MLTEEQKRLRQVEYQRNYRARKREAEERHKNEIDILKDKISAMELTISDMNKTIQSKNDEIIRLRRRISGKISVDGN